MALIILVDEMAEVRLGHLVAASAPHENRPADVWLSLLRSAAHLLSQDPTACRIQSAILLFLFCIALLSSIQLLPFRLIIINTQIQLIRYELPCSRHGKTTVQPLGTNQQVLH